MSAVWLIPVLISLCITQGSTDWPCITPDGNIGDCRALDTCRPLNDLVKDGVLRNLDTLTLLRLSHCGFEEVTRKPKVCCPCVTVTNVTKPGKCVDVMNCNHIITRLSQKPVPQPYQEYVYSLRCEGDAFFSVCCDTPPVLEPELTTTLPSVSVNRPSNTPEDRAGNAPQIMTPTAPVNMPPQEPEGRAPPVTRTPSVYGNTNNCAMTDQPPDPASGCCGIGGASPKIFGGNATGIDQYPWLALIEYEKDHKIKLLCGGALISGRYVLTAGHCVVGPRFNFTVPKNVRLGEYDTSNATDCFDVEGGDDGQQECALDPVTIPIEKIIPYPTYTPYLRGNPNDIALLKLAYAAEYTDYVRPICLPTVDNSMSFGESELYAAGWGAVNDKTSYSSVKQHVKLPYKTLEVCQQSYTAPMRRVTLSDRQMCAGGEAGRDTCKGDSGGPLMHYREIKNSKSYFEVIGVVSFGVTPCGQDNIPGVYTKVFEYLSWIQNVTETT